jgi:ABC-type branched-subunit amino acid transport system ATPase component
MGNPSLWSILKIGIAQVPQDRSLVATMKVRENALLGGFTLPSYADKGTMFFPLSVNVRTISLVRYLGDSKSLWSSHTPRC